MNADHDISEAELINKYQTSKDQSWLGQLFTPYFNLIFGLCLKYFKDRTKAEDAVMDIYELLSRKLLTHDVKDFRPWLFVVSKNFCLEQLRKGQKQQLKKNEAIDMYSATIFHPDDIDKEAQLVKMEECIDKLKSVQKNCIKAFYLEALTYEDIVDKYQIEWNKVRSNIQNGRRNLKKCMETTSTIS